MLTRRGPRRRRGPSRRSEGGPPLACLAAALRRALATSARGRRGRVAVLSVSVGGSDEGHDGSEEGDVEDEANEFAANTLIPPARQSELASLTTPADVKAFAALIDVAPDIVVGRLHHEGHWEWNRGRRLIRKLEIIDQQWSAAARPKGRNRSPVVISRANLHNTTRSDGSPQTTSTTRGWHTIPIPNCSGERRSSPERSTSSWSRVAHHQPARQQSHHGDRSSKVSSMSGPHPG